MTCVDPSGLMTTREQKKSKTLLVLSLSTRFLRRLLGGLLWVILLVLGRTDIHSKVSHTTKTLRALSVSYSKWAKQ